MEHTETRLEFMVLHSESAKEYGMEFWHELTKDVDLDMKLQRELLNKFQKNVMDTFVEVIAESPHVGDGFLDDPEPEVVAVYRIFAEGASQMICRTVVSIIPLDFIGNVGFVTQPYVTKFPTN